MENRIAKLERDVESINLRIDRISAAKQSSYSPSDVILDKMMNVLYWALGALVAIMWIAAGSMLYKLITG